jgi:hypothetical protein
LVLARKDFTDGLKSIINEGDVRAMVEAAAQERKVCLLVNPTNYVWNLRPDMIKPNDRCGTSNAIVPSDGGSILVEQDSGT